MTIFPYLARSLSGTSHNLLALCYLKKKKNKVETFYKFWSRFTFSILLMAQLLLPGDGKLQLMQPAMTAIKWM